MGCWCMGWGVDRAKAESLRKVIFKEMQDLLPSIAAAHHEEVQRDYTL